VLQLLVDIRDRLELTIMFITHDLRVAAQVCDEIAVTRHGEIVELGAAADVFANPKHDYTRELLAAVPGRGWVPTRFGAAPAAGTRAMAVGGGSGGPSSVVEDGAPSSANAPHYFRANGSLTCPRH